MKEGTESKLKFKKLKRRLGMPDWQVIGILESVWKFARLNTPEGDIGRYSNEDIAAGIEYESDADFLIAALTETGWLDADPEFRLIVHDWSEHVPTFMRGNFAKHQKTFADQVAKQRAKQPAKHGANSNVLPSQAYPSLSKPSQSIGDSAESKDIVSDESSCQSEQQTKSSSRNKKTTRKKKRPEYSPSFEEFWNHYPPQRKGDKPDAWKAWNSVKSQGVEESLLIQRAKEYAASDTGRGEYAKMPATWLRKGTYADDPATWQDKGKKEPVSINDQSTWTLGGDGWWRDIDGVRRKREPQQ